MKYFRFIEHTADIAVEINATTVKELFAAGLEAWKSAVVDSFDYGGNETHELNLSAKNLETLLVDFLSEFNYRLTVKNRVFTSIEELSINNYEDGYKLNIIFYDEDIETIGIEMKEEIKAITYHQLEIKRVDGIFTTRIIFDI